MNKKLRVLLTGPYPPPAGGISIHIKRLQQLLKEDFEIDIVDESSTKKPGIFSLRSFNVRGYLHLIRASDVVFIHSGNKLFKKIHIIISKLLRRKVLLTLHGYGPRRAQPFRAIDSWIYSKADKIIVVNDDIPNRVSLPRHKCIMKHAFLPPVMDLEPELPSHLTRWIQDRRQKGSVIICGNASRLDLHSNEDLYGLDMAIEVAKRFKNSSINTSFVFNVSSLEKCQDIYDRNQNMIQQSGLSDNFLLLNERLSFVKLVELSDIVVRPTNADGDALTIREALYLGKDVLASDVITRPDGTSLFKTRSHDDFELKLSSLIAAKNRTSLSPETTAATGTEDFRAFYVNLLQEVALQ